jgi:hypothetical protein
MHDEPDVRPVPGYEDRYEITQCGRLFAKERTIVQDDVLGRTFVKTIKRHEKVRTVNGRGYPAFNLNKDGKQSCRLVHILVREAWGQPLAAQEARHDAS